MKKIMLLLGFVAMGLTSCSSDSDSSGETSNDGLVKKIVYTSITDDYTETATFTYNGNKLVKAVYNDGTEERYTYTGNLITKVEFVDGGDVIATETFEYDSSDRLIEYVIDDEGFVETETFVYNPDGSASSSIDGAPVRTMHFQNNELIQIVNNDGRTYNYTYDGKNSPFKNVTGYNKVAFVMHGDHEFFGATQNIANINEATNDIDYMTNTMTYNADNYPVTASSVAIFEFDGTYEANITYTYY